MNIKDIINQNEYSVILCLGDSITEANHCTEGYLGYAELLNEALRKTFTKRKFVLINAGIGGTRAKHSVDYVRGLVSRFKPQLTTVMYGMNDSIDGEDEISRFSQAMGEIVDAAREYGSKVVLLTQNPLDYTCSIKCITNRPCLPLYMDAVRECAAKKDVTLVDINAAWQSEVLDQDNNEHFKLLHDGIHPNHHGHRFFFEQIEKQLLNNN